MPTLPTLALIVNAKPEPVPLLGRRLHSLLDLILNLDLLDNIRGFRCCSVRKGGKAKNDAEKLREEKLAK